MELTKRQISIIQKLNSEIPTPGQLIATTLHLSLRTVQSEIRAINQLSKETLILSSNRGYQLVKNTTFTFEEQLENDNETLVFKMIILNDFSYNIDDLADELYVSTSTLNAILNNLKNSISPYNLSLIKKNNTVSLVGDELSRRKAIHSLIIKEINLSFDNIENASNYFKNLNINRVKSIILETIHKYNYILESCYETNLIVNILVALSRIREKFSIGNFTSSIDKDCNEYKIASEICNQLSNHWYFSIEENDILYISMLLTGQIKKDLSHSNLFFEDNLVSNKIISLIHNTFDYYMITIDYNQFLANFTLHISALIKRAQTKQYAANLIASSIKETSPFTYDVAVHLAKEIEDSFQIKIIDEEIGLLSIYIGFIIEQSSSTEELVKTLVLCSDYHRMSDHLIARMNQYFGTKIKIINFIFNTSEIPHYKDIDLIITTMPLPNPTIPHVLISPFFSDIDITQTENKLNTLLMEKKKIKYKKMMLNFFNEKLFFKNIDFTNSDDAIRFLSQQVINEGICDSSFTDSVLKRESTSSTCFFNLFAVPHAIELNAKKTQICVLLNENGIPWNGSSVNCVFLIAVCKEDRKDFMKIYTGIIQVLCNTDILHQIIHVSSFMEFINMFNTMSN